MRNKKWVGIFTTFVLIIGVYLISSPLIKQYNAYKDYANSPSTSPVIISIISPLNGHEQHSGSILDITFLASSENRLNSFELWVNGILLESQTIPEDDQGQHPFSFSWLLPQPGTYSITIRASDIVSNTGDSNPVIIKVIPSENVGLISEFNESLSGGGNPPGSNDSVAPGVPWEGSIVESISQNSVGDSVNPPALTLDVQDCGVTLNIQDLSKNETGLKFTGSCLISPVGN